MRTVRLTDIPRKTPRNIEPTTIAQATAVCIAAIPSSGGRRAKAFITKDEKAKKAPAISPQPSAATRVKTKSIEPTAPPRRDEERRSPR